MDDDLRRDYRLAGRCLSLFGALTLLNVVVLHGTGYVWGPLFAFAFYLGRLDRATREAAR